jgi:hypothetical protein
MLRIEFQHSISKTITKINQRSTHLIYNSKEIFFNIKLIFQKYLCSFYFLKIYKEINKMNIIKLI